MTEPNSETESNSGSNTPTILAFAALAAAGVSSQVDAPILDNVPVAVESQEVVLEEEWPYSSGPFTCSDKMIESFGSDYCIAYGRYYEAQNAFFEPEKYPWIVTKTEEVSLTQQATIRVTTERGYDNTMTGLCSILTVEDEPDFIRVLCDKTDRDYTNTTRVTYDLSTDEAFCDYYDIEDFKGFDEPVRYNIDDLDSCSGNIDQTRAWQCARISTLRHMFVKRFVSTCPGEVAPYMDTRQADLEIKSNLDLDGDGIIGSVSQRQHYYLDDGSYIKYDRPSDLPEYNLEDSI